LSVALAVISTYAFLSWLVAAPLAAQVQTAPQGNANVSERPRVIVSTDIGGTDPDDFQSLVHFFLYADMFDVEGLISSPYGPGRREHILQVIDRYAADYPNLKTHSARYPSPDDLRRVTRQGATDSAPAQGVARATEGSDWIVRSARRNDLRPLWVLVWGGIDDLAQALHDAPDILPKLRVYFIGGPNKMWSVDAYNYIEQHHPALWMIEANATYRGWFTGGNQTGEWSNAAFVTTHVRGRGALGDFFATLLGGSIKMGDSPSVGYLLHGRPDDPSAPGWGGAFVRIWDGRKTTFDRLTTESDQAEAFGVVEFAMPVPAGMTRDHSARMIFDGRIPAVATNDGRTLRFRFSPRDAKVWPYVIRSDYSALDGLSGQFRAQPPSAERTRRSSSIHPNWWIDDPDPAAAEGIHPGAKSVSRWREAFLRDFALRLLRGKSPASPQPSLAAREKARVIVLTDIENEPDDAQSMVRFLTYVNQWDVEGLIATTSVHQKEKTAASRIREIVEAYRKVRENLAKHEPGYPEADYLLSIIREGRPAYGMSAVGPGMDSPGSDLIVDALQRSDPRPVWVLVWGGPNCLAQALWKLRASRSPDEVKMLVAKLRVYTISDQDDSGPWLRKTFPDLFYIASPGMHAGGAYHHATWSGISGDMFHGRFVGADFSSVDNPWLDEHIRSKGPLGAAHPRTTFLMEGDTPSFLYLVDNGLGDRQHPDWGSWGGRYELYTPRGRKWFYEPETRPFWSDTEDEVLGVDGRWHTSNKATIWRWRQAYQNDFRARMDWTIKPYAEANHPPVVRLGHPSQLAVTSGDRVNLAADGSSDPDGHALSYEWFYYGEPGTLLLSSGRTAAPLAIEGADAIHAWFTAPRVTKPETIHIILAVTDRGTPPLTRYQRVIVTVSPGASPAAPLASAQAAASLQVRWGVEVLRQQPGWYDSVRASWRRCRSCS
jgi:Protein of unknown function (DUF1593)